MIIGWPRSLSTTGGGGASASVAAAAAFTRAFCARYGSEMPSNVSRTSCWRVKFSRDSRKPTAVNPSWL